MVKLKTINFYINEEQYKDDAELNIKISELKSTLWNHGWDDYWDSHTKLSKQLNKFRSVSDLPANTTKEKLKSLSNSLTRISREIESEFKEMANQGVFGNIKSSDAN